MQNRRSKFHEKREHFSNRVTHQFRRHEPVPQMNNQKKQIKSMEKIDRKTFSKSYEMKRAWKKRKQNDVNLKTGASSWLTTLPIKEKGYTLNKQGFWDLLSIRYDWRLK